MPTTIALPLPLAAERPRVSLMMAALLAFYVVAAVAALMGVLGTDPTVAAAGFP